MSAEKNPNESVSLRNTGGLFHASRTVQTSESFLLSAVLSMSGGFQDAYTYLLRGGVFANAQTGNVVLMSHYFMSGDPKRALSYLAPLLAFAAGIFIAEQIGHYRKHSRRPHWRQLIVLLEILILAAVALIPASLDPIANMFVSFACAMQVQAFRKVNGLGYASTMCIGNLRSGTENLSVFFREKERSALVKALHYYGIIFFFALGAGLGGFVSEALGLRSILLSCALLMSAAVMMNRRSIPSP